MAQANHYHMGCFERSRLHYELCYALLQRRAVDRPVKAMGILDGIVEWIAEQIMYGLDMINTSVLGALGCDMNTFLRYFPAAETMYSLLVALAIGLILLGWIWNLFKNYGLGLGIEAEDPVRLTAKAILFIVLAYYADEIVNIALTIGGTPYAWILSSELPSLDFASFNSVLLTIIGVCANGGVALIVLILTLILAWNYIKLLFEAAERVCAARSPGLYRTGSLRHGRLAIHRKYFQKLVPDVWRSDISAVDERMVSAVVSYDGWHIYFKSTFLIGGHYHEEIS